MVTILDASNPRVGEIGRANAFREWAQVLARPAVFRSLQRVPAPEHLLHLLEEYEPFARARREGAAERGYLSGADEACLPELVDRMRLALEAWSPPGLPVGIVDAARALLVADRFYARLDWEQGPELDPGEAVEDGLVWPG